MTRPERHAGAVVAISFSVMVASLNSSVAHIALPVIARDVGVSAATSVWVTNAYQIALVLALLPMATLGDLAGQRRVLVGGLVVFVAGSLASALAPSFYVLVGARALQGLGAAGVFAVNQALVRVVYPRFELGRGMGLNTAVIAASQALGPTLAAGVLSLASWRWLFLIFVPLGLVAALMSVPLLPRGESSSRRVDVGGTLLSAVAIGTLFIGIDAFAKRREGSTVGLALVVAIATGFAFVRRELVSADPMFPIGVLRGRFTALSLGAMLGSFVVQGLALVSLPFYLQDTLSISRGETGLILTTWPLAIMAVAPIAGRLADRLSPSLLGAGGMSCLAIGFGSLAISTATSSTPAIVIRLVACGAGVVLFQTPNTRVLLGLTAANRVGAMSGVLATVRALGLAAGAAIVAFVFERMPLSHGPRGTRVIAVIGAIVAALAAAASLARGSVATREASAND